MEGITATLLWDTAHTTIPTAHTIRTHLGTLPTTLALITLDGHTTRGIVLTIITTPAATTTAAEVLLYMDRATLFPQ